MKNPLLTDEDLKNTIVKKIANLIEDIDPRTVEKQLDEFDEDTTREIIYRISNYAVNHETIDSLRNFIGDKFSYEIIHAPEYYKLLSEKFNGKYSPEELELIANCQNELIHSLLKDNDIVETGTCLFNKKYDEDCYPNGVSVLPNVNIVLSF